MDSEDTGYYGSHVVTARERESWAAETEASDEPSGDARRALAHVRGRTIGGRFACCPYDWPEDRWQAALEELRADSYQIEWTFGTVADDPSISGGYVLRGHAAEQSQSLGMGL